MSQVMRLTRRIAELSASPREGLARLASVQHGVVATWQLLILGYSQDLIRAEVAAKRLHRLHRGVYAVGHTRLTRKARWMAAVLAYGPDAVLSHRAAAALHEVRSAPSGPIDVTVAGRHQKRTGIRVHCVRRLDPADCTMIDGIPVTSLERTLVDYAAVAGEQWTRLAVEAAQRQERLDAEPMNRMLARSRGRAGVATLRAVLPTVSDEAPWSASEPERRLMAGIRGRGLPGPSMNVIVADELVDFHWRAEGLVVEVDGDFWHKTKAARERDRRRDVKLQLHGQMVARFGADRVMQELEAVLDEIEELLRLSRARRAGGGA
jgi:very-short-patch-repair endonuclease/predicted transcriptional regulator of viral defense system